jgi:hypothetical protein
LIALIGFILPPVGLAMAIVLGVKGSEWAWQNRRFEGGVTQFRAVQRVWAIWGWVIFVLIFLVPVILVVVAVMMKATAPVRRVPGRYGAASVGMVVALPAAHSVAPHSYAAPAILMRMAPRGGNLHPEAHRSLSK